MVFKPTSNMLSSRVLICGASILSFFLNPSSDAFALYGDARKNEMKRKLNSFLGNIMIIFFFESLMVYL